MKWLLAGMLTLLVLALGLVWVRAPGQNLPYVGENAPAFRLRDQAGHWHRLADYRGRWIVLYFYPKDGTPACTQEACRFRDDIQTLSALGVQVLGVSLDSPSSHRSFARKYQLPFPLLSDMDGKVTDRYGALFSFGPLRFAKRHTFLIDPNGYVLKVYNNVDSDTHVHKLVSDLQAFLAAQSKNPKQFSI